MCFSPPSYTEMKVISPYRLPCKLSLNVLFVMWVLFIYILCNLYWSSYSKLTGKTDYDDWKAFDQSLNKLVDKSSELQSSQRPSRFRAWGSLQSLDDLRLKQIYNSLAMKKDPLGSEGSPVIMKYRLTGNVKALLDNGWKHHAFNQLISDLIPSNRTLLDPRHALCKAKNYDSSKFPRVSVIICFHNEAYSTLVRTITSVIDRTRPEFLKEIILVDDHSEFDDLKLPLSEFIKTQPLVKLIRCKFRKGLIRAKIIGAKTASAPILVFLDSHCECTNGWLEPLLDTLMTNNHTIVSPVVDHIHDETFEYIAQDINDLQIGGFTWNLQFIWKTIPNEVLRKRNDVTEPINTPTISGGLFAITKKYFKYLGYYDPGFDVWGGENLEMSFKTWMCGGALKIAPCSHVGHVFRKTFPYTGVTVSLRKNLARLAEVWMDDYKKYYYERNGNLSGLYENVTEAKLLRERLNCKSFSWYLNEIYPDIDNPKTAVGSGQIANLGLEGYCMDAPSTYNEIFQQTQLIRCHHNGGNQFWTYTKYGELKRDAMCLECNKVIGYVTLNLCRRHKSQMWIYNKTTKRIKHVGSGKCLFPAKIIENVPEYYLVLMSCGDFVRQKWEIEHFNSTYEIILNVKDTVKHNNKSLSLRFENKKNNT